MPAVDRCPSCGGELLANVPRGLCPRCLLRQGMELQPGSKGTQASSVAHLRPYLAPWGEQVPGLQDHSRPAWTSSVGATLATSLGSFPRILLRETQPGDWTPVSRPSSLEIPAREVDRGKYQILGEIARGGMGAVLKGRDTDLGRDLAVKVLLESHRHDPALIRRFIEEAQIGGQLQHPGIVPVYELGCFTDQRPFFTMKLIKGQTLAAMLQARSTPGWDRARFLSIFESVCQTMAYAHARGVVHRDLKPSNVMVGSFGEVQVMDWGLAKVLRSGGAADERSLSPEGESSVKTARSGSDQDASRAGSVLGTPAYMPPEQARGDIGAVNERADVFALGAILCEILTGHPPYVGDIYVQVHGMAVEGNLAPAFERLISSDADSDLIDLAQRCLAPVASDRPHAAGEVSRAMTSYLASVQERLHAAEIDRAQAEARTVEERKRRRIQIWMAAAIVLALLGGMAGVATQWSRAEANLRKSEARLKLANEAIERFYTGASEDVLLKEPQLKSLREKLLNSALQFYKKLQASLEAESGEFAGAELASAYERVGETTAQIGTQEGALAAFGQARAIRQRLADLQPGSEPVQEALATVLEKESDCLSEVGKTAEALQTLEQARTIRQRLADDHPGVVRHQLNVARTDGNLGNLLGYRMNRKPDAQESLKRSISAYDALMNRGHAELDTLRGLGEVLGIQGKITQEMGNMAGALEDIEKAVTIYEEVVRQDPVDLSSREKLGRLLMNRGYYASNLNQLQESGRSLQGAVEIFKQLTLDQPNASLYQFHLGRARQSLAWWLQRSNRKSDAMNEFHEALQLFDRVAQDHPGVTEYVSNQCMCLTNIGDLLRSQGHLDEALEILRRAQAISDRLIRQNPEVDHLQTKWVDLQITVASLLSQMGRQAEAEKSYERALADAERLEHRDGISFYNIACAHACLASLINGQSARLTDARRAAASRHLDAAMPALRQAAEAGYRIARVYSTDIDLTPLRSRADFQDLIRDLSFPARPFAD